MIPPRIGQPFKQQHNRFQPYLSVITNQALIVLTLTVGDALVTSWRPTQIPAQFWALWDSPVHGLLALLITAPVFARNVSRRRTLFRLAMVCLAPMLIDIDHFIAAGSLSLYKATHLPFRPATHSLLFGLALALLVSKITGDSDDAYLLFTALASHFLRDASSGGIPFLLWPIPFDRLSPLTYYAVQLGLSVASWMHYYSYKGIHYKFHIFYKNLMS